MNNSFLSKLSFFSKELSNNDNEIDLQELLVSEACIRRMIMMRIKKLKN